MTREQVIMRMFHVPGIGARTIARLLRLLAMENRPVTDLVSATNGELVHEYGLSDAAATSLREDNAEAEALLDHLTEHDIKLIDIGTTQYPALLIARLGRTAPPVLFARGNAELLNQPTVGMAGARDCSPEGLEASGRIAALFSDYNVCVASGYAPGVDTAAHHGTLVSGGATIIVLASGILHFSPRENLASFMDDSNALVISEFFPTLPWKSHSAMTRNRTIAGLSKALVVVEAATTGGTFAAAKAAVETGCPLFVVDRPNLPPGAEGNRVLLQRNGRPLRVDESGKPDDGDIRKIIGIDPTAFKPQSSLFD